MCLVKMAYTRSRQGAEVGVLAFLCCLLHGVSGIGIHKTELATAGISKDASINYKTHEISLPVDHFGFANQDTFKLRYLVADQFWDPENGPVFFYTGNEGDIAWFCNNTGFMWDIAPEFKAMLVFAEHRYYGTSMPYGKDSYKDIEHLGYLSSEQALADFVSLITYLRSTKASLAKAPFIAFGGSYGGMLASWIRMKYPHAIQGSVAASAPIWYFGDLTPCDSFFRITTADFQRESDDCPKNIKQSWAVITNMGKTESGRSTLTKIFKLCKPLKSEADVVTLKGWLSGTYGNMAMVDYPYSASFLEPLPPWPIKVACKHLSTRLTGESLLAGVADAIGVYFNSTGRATCYNITQQASASLGDLGWSFQACSEMVMPMCSNGETDMFEANPWNLTAFTKDCQAQWGVTPRRNAAIQEYGGKNITAASNIIFSNGLLDPWSGAGVMKSLSTSLIAVVIADGAHHLDLRSANPADPPSVISAREKEKAMIWLWISQYQKQLNSNELETEHHQVIVQHTTAGTQAVVFGLLVLVAFGAAAVVFVKIRNQPHTKVNVVQCSAAPLWTEVDPATSKLRYVSTESLNASEKRPLLT